VLGNVLAVLYDIAPPDRAKQIMSFLHAHGAADPFPARTYLRPLRNGDNARIYHKVQDRFQDPRWRNPPGSYHNGAIWPFIGGLYVSALQHVGMVDEAVASMRALAEAVRLSSNDEPFGFHEWIGLDGTPSTIRDQAWSAGTFLAAYHRLTAAGAAPASGSGPER